MKNFVTASLFLLLAVTGLAQGRGDIKTVDTLVILSNFPTSTVGGGGVVATLGRATAGDGDGAVYTWTPASSATVDQTNVIGSSITGTGRWLLSIGSGGGGGGSGVVTDGDYGDITVSGTGLAWDINANAVAYTNIQGVSSASRLLGRGSSGGPGNVQELTIANSLTLTGTALAVTTPLVSGDTGDITFALGGTYGFTTSIDNRSVSFAKMPLAVASSIFGREAGSSGDAANIPAGLGIEITGGEIRINTNTIGWATGVSEVESMAELVTAVSGTNHAQLYFVKSYYPNRPGQGDGWWYWDPNSEYPVSGGVVASGRSGRFLPVFPNNKIDVTMFGAITKGNSTTNNNAFQAALFLQQDRTKGGVMYVPIGDYPITGTIRKKTKGTGTKYLVNNASNYPIGATNILIDTGTGTFVPGDAVSFGNPSVSQGAPQEPSSEEYRVVAYNSGTGELQLAYPGLRSVLTNNWVVTIHEPPRLAIVGDNHGVTQVASERSVSTSNIMMETANIPIIELGGYHNLVQNLTLVYVSFQGPANANAACIFNPGSQRLYQAVISGVSMHRGAYGIHVQTGSETAPNNWLYNILVETASISSIYWNKSGTENWGGGWYLQNYGDDFSDGLPIAVQGFTNVIKSTTNTQVTLQLATLPGNIQVGSWIEIDGTSLDGLQFVTTYATNGEIKFDMKPSEIATTVTGTSGNVILVCRRKSTKPQFYNIAQFDITGLDTETTIGSDDVNTPICIHNVRGKLTINGLHFEYIHSRVNGQPIVQNNGGALTIRNADIINSGRLGEIDVYVFKNTTSDGSTNGTPGHMDVSMFGSRDMSDTTGIGNWILATNLTSNPQVIIGQYHADETYRNNATHITQVGQAKTPTTATLTIP